jgi:RNA polymerase sigma-70 factor, ECF subfamily
MVMAVDQLSAPAMAASSDGIAIERSLTAPEAFTEVFERHFVAVHRYLARRAGRDRADDLAAQAFTVAFARRQSYRDGLGSARPWLLGIATNLLREDHRSEQRLLATMAGLGNEALVSRASPGPGEAPSDPALAAALASLDPVQRDALLLHVWGELSYAEIADSTGVPIGTIRSRISRACAALRTALRVGAASDEEER